MRVKTRIAKTRKLKKNNIWSF